MGVLSPSNGGVILILSQININIKNFMKKEQFLEKIKGMKIADLIFSDESTDEPVKILGIISDDGYHYEFENLKMSHPEYEKELGLFLEQLEKAKPDSFFEITTKFLSLDEMRKYADDHRKKINANGGNVNSNFNGKYKVSFGEDLGLLLANRKR
jgi:hypothetical protein